MTCYRFKAARHLPVILGSCDHWGRWILCTCSVDAGEIRPAEFCFPPSNLSVLQGCEGFCCARLINQNHRRSPQNLHVSALSQDLNLNRDYKIVFLHISTPSNYDKFWSLILVEKVLCQSSWSWLSSAHVWMFVIFHFCSVCKHTAGVNAKPMNHPKYWREAKVAVL